MFYGGWISKNRSIDLYFDLAIELKKKGIGVDFEVCGWGDENYLISLESLFRKHDIGFVYLGQLSQQETIEYLKKSDVSIAFYNPNKIINILAASNKIPEIIGSNTILITNEQTEIAKNIRPMNISLQFKHDITEVVDGLVELITDKVALSEFIRRSKAFYSKEYCPNECKKCLEIVFHEFT
jgi:glycosyltransferase involved in cell wall biosynthesis